jgi:chromosome segregation and condensation protein ScpB
LVLKADFERIRNRVYGLGPKDVKLTQDALEVLAMIAYRQPVTREVIIEKGPKNASSLLNQLLRRELIILERVGDTRNDVEYTTTDRFYRSSASSISKIYLSRMTWRSSRLLDGLFTPSAFRRGFSANGP